jgi:ABC-type transport system involved in cytochrome bd biosynthesis fused ATPase/permease subunit
METKPEAIIEEIFDLAASPPALYDPRRSAPSAVGGGYLERPVDRCRSRGDRAVRGRYTVKIKKLSIEGFRGVPKHLEMRLDGKSLCLLAENGRGKTTIVDALEYWSTGSRPSL